MGFLWIDWYENPMKRQIRNRIKELKQVVDDRHTPLRRRQEAKKILEFNLWLYKQLWPNEIH